MSAPVKLDSNTWVYPEAVFAVKEVPTGHTSDSRVRVYIAGGNYVEVGVPRSVPYPADRVAAEVWQLPEDAQ